MKSDLDQKRDLLTALESDLAKAVHWNGQISESFHKCDIDLSKYAELVGQLSDRWRRIQTQIDSRQVTYFSCASFFPRGEMCLKYPLSPTLSFPGCGTWKNKRSNWIIISRAALPWNSGLTMPGSARIPSKLPNLLTSRL